MTRSLTYVIEFLVGIACLGLGAVAWRHDGVMRIAAAVFTVAGVSAVAHAVLELAQ